MNVGGKINFVDGNRVQGKTQGQAPRNIFEESLIAEANAITEELRDWGSERRHRQLLSICEQHGLSHLPSQALQSTRQRQAKEQKHGLLDKPGAYYQRILISLLEGHQVFVPKANEDDVDEVRRLVRESLRIGAKTGEA